MCVCVCVCVCVGVGVGVGVAEWYFGCAMFVLSQIVGIIFDTDFKGQVQGLG